MANRRLSGKDGSGAALRLLGQRRLPVPQVPADETRSLSVALVAEGEHGIRVVRIWTYPDGTAYRGARTSRPHDRQTAASGLIASAQ
jgi:hypothetical protein